MADYACKSMSMLFASHVFFHCSLAAFILFFTASAVKPVDSVTLSSTERRNISVAKCLWTTSAKIYF